jgi:hypothetical protein
MRDKKGESEEKGEETLCFVRLLRFKSRYSQREDVHKKHSGRQWEMNRGKTERQRERL